MVKLKVFCGPTILTLIMIVCFNDDSVSVIWCSLFIFEKI